MSTNTSTRTTRTSGAPKTLLTPAGFFDNFTVSSWLHRYDAPAVFFCVMPGACARPVVGGARRHELFADQTGYLFCDGAEQAYPATCRPLIDRWGMEPECFPPAPYGGREACQRDAA